MLILVAVTIQVVVNSGLFGHASDSTTAWDVQQTREQIIVDLMGRYDNAGNYTNDDVIASVKAVTGQEIEEGTSTITTDKGNEVDISDLWIIGTSTGGETEGKVISTDTSYIGCYADFDGNGSIDGLIYADLAQSKSGKWSDDSISLYAYEEKSNLKSYYIREEKAIDDFGELQVISPVNGTEGEDRFYIMALDDFIQGTDTKFYWYFYSSGRTDTTNCVSGSYNDFGAGKSNTLNMIDKWNKAYYGTKIISGSYKDLWGAIQDEQYDLISNEYDSCKWFIPSKSEWSAFGDTINKKLNVTTSNYSDYKLNDVYWTSSCKDELAAWCGKISKGFISHPNVTTAEYVRLSATF